MEVLLGLLKIFFKPILKFIKWTFLKLKLFYFNLREMRPWLDKETAMKIAQMTLSGSVISAFPFRNLNSKRKYIAALRKESDEGGLYEIFLLEEVGKSYRIDWKSEEIHSIQENSFKVVDVGNDGYKSISYIQEYFGSGMGTRHLYIYHTAEKRIFEIREDYNYSTLQGPAFHPKILAGDHEKFRRKLIKYAVTQDFLLESELPDYNKSKFAAQRWHKENGNRIIGKIKTYRYEGEPNYYGIDPIAISDTEHIRWVSYFKGPLFRYDKRENNHYVVYSPVSVYEWAKSLLGVGKGLFFSCHCLSGLNYYEDKNRTLHRFCGYNNEPIDSVDEIYVQDGIIYLATMNDEVIKLTDLNLLMKCQNYCCFAEPHLPKNCRDTRFEDDDTIVQTFI
jgi:hypothetical protein